MRKQEEKPKKSTAWWIGLIVALVLGMTLVTVAILQPWQNTSQNTPHEQYTSRYSSQVVGDMAINYVWTQEKVEAQSRGWYAPSKPTLDHYPEYLGNGLWKVKVQSSRSGIVTVYVDEQTGTVH